MKNCYIVYDVEEKSFAMDENANYTFVKGYEKACKEAQRMAQKNPGCGFAVFSALTMFKAKAGPVTETDL